MSRTAIISVHPFRRVARKREREMQVWVDEGRPLRSGAFPDGWERIPEWARGVRVEKAGLFSYAVVATDHKGH